MKFHKKSSKKRGFTLIELLVVIVIIAILATIGMVSYTRAMASARDNKRRADMENVRQALVMYRSELGGYPCQGTFTAMMSELAADYWAGEIPTDPRSPDQDYVYEVLPSTCAGLASGTSFILEYNLETVDPAENPQELVSP